MKSTKFFIAFTFLLAFAVYGSAQTNQYPNEIKGFEFFKDQRLNNLKLLTSDKEAVKAAFGKCGAYICDYDENWTIGFVYVAADSGKKIIEAGSERIYKPKPEFIGKLLIVYFHPKKPILLSESVLIPKELVCRVGTVKNPDYVVRLCVDDERVIYNISDETTADGKILKGQIMIINYLPSEKDHDDIFALVEQK